MSLTNRVTRRRPPFSRGRRDVTYDDPILSNTSVGGKRLTWRELVELQEEELTRLRGAARALNEAVDLTALFDLELKEGAA